MIATTAQPLAREAAATLLAERLVREARSTERPGRWGKAVNPALTVTTRLGLYYVRAAGQTRYAEGHDDAVRLVARVLGEGR